MSSLLGSGGGSGAGYAQPVADLTALAALATDGLPDGSLVYVNSVDDIYTLETTGSYTDDGHTVIDGLDGGAWIARYEGRWDDQQGDISQGAGQAASLSYDTFRNTPWRVYCMRHDINPEMHFVYQMDHSWRYDLPVFPHLHVLPLADPASSEDAYFEYSYVWTRPNYASNPIPVLSGWTSSTLTITVDPGDVFVQKIVSLGEVTPPSWARESSVFILYIKRAGTNGNDTYDTNKGFGSVAAANLGLLSADIHFRKDKVGTITQFPTP